MNSKRQLQLTWSPRVRYMYKSKCGGGGGGGLLLFRIGSSSTSSDRLELLYGDSARNGQVNK